MNNFLAWEHQTSSNHPRLSIRFGRPCATCHRSWVPLRRHCQHASGACQWLQSRSPWMGEVSWLNQALVVTCCDISMIVTSAEHAEQKERCPLFGDLSTKDMDHTNSQATQVHHRPTICRIPTDQKKRGDIGPEVPTLAEGHGDQHVVQSARDRPSTWWAGRKPADADGGGRNSYWN